MVLTPPRAEDPKGLPYTYMEVGTLDMFICEDVEYARRLHDACVEIELHVWPGMPHGLEGVVPGNRYSQSAMDARGRAVRSV